MPFGTPRIILQRQISPDGTSSGLFKSSSLNLTKSRQAGVIISPSRVVSRPPAKRRTRRNCRSLIQIYVSFDYESLEKQFEFRPLAARWIVEESKALDQSRAKSSGSDEKSVSVPDDIKSRGPELVKAWKTYKALCPTR